MPGNGHFSAAWQLVSAYWQSAERMTAWLLLLGVIALDLMMVYRSVCLTYWQKDFYDALSGKAIDAFWSLLAKLGMFGLLAVLLDTSRTWLAQHLEMSWRSWLTSELLDKWLARDTHRHDMPENPDQRLAEDLKLLASGMLSAGLGLLGNVVSFFSFASIVYTLSGTLSFAVLGQPWQITGHALWVAILYAVIGSVLMEKFAGKLVRADYTQQRVEADFRSELISVREHRQEIALQRAEQAAGQRLYAAFDEIRHNWHQILRYTKRVTAADRLYTEAGALVPYILAGPLYFAGRMTLGDLMQLTQAFMRVRASLSWFIYRYKDLAQLRATCLRLLEFRQTLDHCQPSGIDYQTSTDGSLHMRSLSLQLPDGRRIIEQLDWAIRPGERWLLSGASGCGKSTLLRAIAGIWPHGSGRITTPGAMMFLPQRIHFPRGSIRAFLCYPLPPAHFSPAACRQAMHRTGMDKLDAQLEQHADWARILSPGELQRLAFARVLLQQPAVLFLDEASSALDNASEAALYQLLCQCLPQLTLISVAHRPALMSYHNRHGQLGSDGRLTLHPHHVAHH